MTQEKKLRVKRANQRSSKKGLMHTKYAKDIFLESLILAQDERWRRA